MNLNDWRASVSPQGPALVRSDGCSSSHPLWRGGAKLIITMTTDRSALLQRSPDTMECCIAPTPPPGLPFRVKTYRSGDGERTADKPPIADLLVQRRERGMCAMNRHWPYSANPALHKAFAHLRRLSDFLSRRPRADRLYWHCLVTSFRNPARTSSRPGTSNVVPPPVPQVA